MQPVVSIWGFCLSLFLGMVFMIELGRRIGERRRARGIEDDKTGLAVIEGAVFALFGLMIAFTFSGAATRFNEKRMLVAEEADAIEIAYMRLEALPEDARAPLQAMFRDYLDSRLETYRRLPDMAAATQEMERTAQIREKLWSAAVAASGRKDARADAGPLVIPPISAMIDVAMTRTMALHIHPPPVIYGLLFGLGLLCSLLAGFRMSGVKHRSWIHILVFAAITVSVVYVIMDIEYPRAGLIRLGADQFLVDVRHSMQ